MIKQKLCRLSYIVGIILLVNSVNSLPAGNEESTESNESTTEPDNETAQNLYVIKSVVYEIGILTDATDDTDSSNETHEEVDVSFFDPGHNGSLIDLSNIPVPIQTNISGVTVTGILPADLGVIYLNKNGTASLNSKGSAFPILPNKEIRVTHNISTNNKDESSAFLSGLPKILGLDKVIKTSNGTEEGHEDEKVEGIEEATEGVKTDTHEEGTPEAEENVDDKDDEAKAS